jgi:hypothetical protein
MLFLVNFIAELHHFHCFGIMAVTEMWVTLFMLVSSTGFVGAESTEPRPPALCL